MCVCRSCVPSCAGAESTKKKKKKKTNEVFVVVVFVENVRVILSRSLYTQRAKILLVCLFLYFY